MLLERFRLIFRLTTTFYFAQYGATFSTYSTLHLPLDSEQQYAENVGCTFPDDVQGTFKTQERQTAPVTQSPLYNEYELRDPIKYREIFIGPSSVPLWGDCVSKRGSSYILGLKKVGGYTCYRCFVIVALTPNVLQAYTSSENACYRSESEAGQTCIDTNSVQWRDAMMLYRSQNVKNQYCPVGGKANLTYTSGRRLNCPYPSTVPSTISNCQYGYQLDVSLRGCTFPAYDISFRCLGTWDAGRNNGETFFAVYSVASDEYRCGLFKEAKEFGAYAVAALSNDSSCTNMLSNSSYGYERFMFFKDFDNGPKNDLMEWPQNTCVFPEWISGEWETMTIGREIINFYEGNDVATMSALRGKCVEIKDEKLKIYTKSQCGDILEPTCMWFKSRGPSFLEVKLISSTQPQSAVEHSCFDENMYADVEWSALIPRALAGEEKLVACPFFGSFSTPGIFQKKGRFCYDISTDCETPYQFQLTTYLCNSTDIYDVQLFQCLASWEDETKTRFTFLNRTRDGVKTCWASQTDPKEKISLVARMDSQCRREIDFDRLLSIEHLENPILILQEMGTCSGSNAVTDGNGSKTAPSNVFPGGKRRPNSAASSTNTCLFITYFFIVYRIFKIL